MSFKSKHNRYKVLDGHGGSSGQSQGQSHHHHHQQQQQHHHQSKHRNDNRRVTFKTTKSIGGKAHQQRPSPAAIRELLNDDDTQMELSFRKPLNYRRGSPAPKGQRVLKPATNTFGWYKVRVNSAETYPKDTVVFAFQEALGATPFTPYYWLTESDAISFCIKDRELAEQLYSIKQLRLSDGLVVFPRIFPSYPSVTVDESYKERLKMAMVKRYSVANRALDLSKFQSDEAFQDIFCSLAVRPIMLAVLDIVQTNVPNVIAIKLDDNGIDSLEAFKNAENRFPHLACVHLAKNRLRHVSALVPFIGCPIVEMTLKDNPVQQKKWPEYISELRRRFPLLTRLDDEILPEIRAPLTKPITTYVCNPSAVDIVRTFVLEYFAMYDSHSRQGLLKAYSERSQFSLSLPFVTAQENFKSYYLMNRNFRRLNTDTAIKSRLLKTGCLSIVAVLNELPRTKHFQETFTLDMVLSTPQLMSFTITGVFREEKHMETQRYEGEKRIATPHYFLRHFVRTFTLAQQNGGYCIKNDLLCISTASPGQRRYIAKLTSVEAELATAVESFGLDGLATATTSATVSPLKSPATATATDENALKAQMVTALQEATKMNAQWSARCLEETGWDYNKAINAFNELYMKNAIPAEAFAN